MDLDDTRAVDWSVAGGSEGSISADGFYEAFSRCISDQSALGMMTVAIELCEVLTTECWQISRAGKPLVENPHSLHRMPNTNVNECKTSNRNETWPSHGGGSSFRGEYSIQQTHDLHAGAIVFKTLESVAIATVTDLKDKWDTPTILAPVIISLFSVFHNKLP